MESKFLKMFSYWAISLFLVVATLLIVHWTRSSIPWDKLDSGWAQTIGSAAALLLTHHLFEKQRTIEGKNASDNELLRHARTFRMMSELFMHCQMVVQETHSPWKEGKSVSDGIARLDELERQFYRFIDPTIHMQIVTRVVIFVEAVGRIKNAFAEPYTSEMNERVAKSRERLHELNVVMESEAGSYYVLCSERGLQR